MVKNQGSLNAIDKLIQYFNKLKAEAKSEKG